MNEQWSILPTDPALRQIAMVAAKGGGLIIVNLIIQSLIRYYVAATTLASFALRFGIGLVLSYFTASYISVQTHGDLDYGEQPMSLVSQGTPEEALAVVRNITYNGGGDAAETHGDGIHSAMDSMIWSPDPMARNVLVSFLTADSKDMKDGMPFAELGSRFVTRRIKLVLVCEPTARLKELCDNAKGQLIAISNDPSVDELRAVAKILTKTLTTLATEGKTAPMPPVAVA